MFYPLFKRIEHLFKFGEFSNMIKSDYILEHQLESGKLILFNTVLFRLVVLNRSEYNSWESNDLSGIPLEKSEFLRFHYFVFDDLSQKQAIQGRIKKVLVRKKNCLPFVVFMLTERCNLACVYCFQNRVIGERKLEFTKEGVDYFINALLELQSTHTKPDNYSISIFGGEPLLPHNTSILSYLYDKLDKHGFDTDIVTNATNLPHFDEFFSKFGHRTKSIITTIDGPARIHDQKRPYRNGQGSYQRIVENLKWLVKHYPGIKININVLLDLTNVNLIPELITSLLAEGLYNQPGVLLRFGRIQNRLNPADNSTDELPYTHYYPTLLNLQDICSEITDDMLIGSEMAFLGHLYRSWKSQTPLIPSLNGCKAVYPGRYCFYPDGKVYTCTDIAGISEYAIGSFIPQFEFNDNSNGWKHYSVVDLKKCRNCKYLVICNGGCLVTNLCVNNDVQYSYCLDYERSLTLFFDCLQQKGFFNERNYC
ncbi:MAG: radical SAM protein [Candidatus Cloacimonadaceae bacterium]